VLNEQRNLIETLLKEKTHVETAHVGTIDSNPTICLASLPQTAGPAISFQKNALTVSDQELQDYNSLIRAMLGEIDGCKSKLEKSRHSRIRDGVLNVHSSEIVHFQRNYGSSVFQYFDDSVFDDSIISQSVTTGNLDISPDPYVLNVERAAAIIKFEAKWTLTTAGYLKTTQSAPDTIIWVHTSHLYAVLLCAPAISRLQTSVV
jgi:hypothetical protein